MHIGLIGGIGPAATDFYYRRLISTFASKKAALELTIVHADTPTLLGNLASNAAATQVAIFMKLTDRLAAAGAECVAITSIAGHFCIDAFKASSVLPVGRDLEDVHQAYVAMAASGIVTELHSAVFTAVSKKLLNESGVEAIMLGGTDLALAFNERDTDFPLIDCAGIHADAIAKLATT
jgi:aspartate racemase